MHCSTRQARQLLAASDWNMEVAVNQFFTNPPSKIEPPEVLFDTRKIEALFTDQITQVGCSEIRAGGVGINDEGILQFLQRCGVSEEDEHSEHILAWKCNAKEMGFLSKEEFVKGLAALEVDTREALGPKLAAEKDRVLSDQTLFNAFYRYLFEYVRGTKRAAVDVTEATVVWKMWLIQGAPHHYRHIDTVIQWLQEVDPAPISKDLWGQLCIFWTLMDEQFSSYDPNDAWPIRIDAFMEWRKENPPR